MVPSSATNAVKESFDDTRVTEADLGPGSRRCGLRRFLTVMRGAGSSDAHRGTRRRMSPPPLTRNRRVPPRWPVGRWWAVAALGLAVVAAACGGGGGGGEGDPLALAGEPSGACSQAIMDGHNLEAAGQPMPFLPSVQACGSLGEWTEAAKKFGIDLKGREAQFVDNTCNAASDQVKALPICQEAKAALSDSRSIP